MDDGRWDFFVSYTSVDRAWAEWIAWQLEAFGYRVLIQDWDFVPGSHWTAGMQNGLTRADRTIAVLSNAYLRSVYGQAEWRDAIRVDPAGARRKLIPIRIEECDRPGLLGAVVSFDLYGRTADEARRWLVNRIGAALSGRDRPTAEPTFPGDDDPGPPWLPALPAPSPPKRPRPAFTPSFPGSRRGKVPDSVPSGNAVSSPPTPPPVRTVNRSAREAASQSLSRISSSLVARIGRAVTSRHHIAWNGRATGVLGSTLLMLAVLTASTAPLPGASVSATVDLDLTGLPQSSRMFDAQGSLVAVLHDGVDRELVPLEEIATVGHQSLIDFFDADFYQRGPIGDSAIVRLYVDSVHRLREAGTEGPDGTADLSWPRDVTREAAYLNERLSTTEIVENLLGVLYFGDQAYGIQAAARQYFNVDSSDLTLEQAAVLTGLVEDPVAYNPRLHPLASTERRDLVLDRMYELGHISRPAWDEARASELVLDMPEQRADQCELSTAPFFCAHVRDTLLTDETFGETVQDRHKLLYEGGLTINTTLDLAAQEVAATSAAEYVPIGSRVVANVVVVEPGTGRVLALAMNREYGPPSDGKSLAETTDFVRVQDVYPVAPYLYTPGAAFMPFALATALEHGISLSETYNSPACYHSKSFVNPPPDDCFGNADPNEAGYYSLTTATWHSTYTYYIQLAERVGILDIAEMARRLGVSSCRVEQHGTAERCDGIGGVSAVDGSLVLGANEVSTLDLATAYATLAAGGKRCDPRVVESVVRRVGTDLRDVPFDAGRPCEQVLDREVADQVSAVLQGVVGPNGTGGAAAIGRPAAGMTGTTQTFSAASFAGYIPQLAAAVTLADPRGPDEYPLLDVLGSPVVYGGGIPARIWAATMGRIAEQHALAVEPLPPPDKTFPDVPSKRIPDVNSLSQEVAEDTLAAEGFRYRIQEVPSLSLAGTVVGTAPAVGESAPLGSEITLFVAQSLFGGDVGATTQPSSGSGRGPGRP